MFKILTGALILQNLIRASICKTMTILLTADLIELYQLLQSRLPSSRPRRKVCIYTL